MVRMAKLTSVPKARVGNFSGVGRFLNGLHDQTLVCTTERQEHHAFLAFE